MYVCNRLLDRLASGLMLGWGLRVYVDVGVGMQQFSGQVFVGSCLQVWVWA